MPPPSLSPPKILAKYAKRANIEIALAITAAKEEMRISL